MSNPTHNNSFLSKTETSMPHLPPHDLYFTDNDYSSEYIPDLHFDSQGYSNNLEWLTPTNEESMDEQFNYTENIMILPQSVEAGGGEDQSGDYQVGEYGDNGGINNTPLVVKKQTRKQSAGKRKTAFEMIKKESLELHYGKTLSEAAKSLSVSVPTLKRTCRKHGIPSWPLSKKKKKDLSAEISNTDEVQSFPVESRIVIAKVKYGNDLIKFEISSASNLALLQEEIKKRFKLKDGSFNIKYVDEDGDLILIKVDADIRMFMKNDTPKVNMVVLLSSN